MLNSRFPFQSPKDLRRKQFPSPYYTKPSSFQHKYLPRPNGIIEDYVKNPPMLWLFLWQPKKVPYENLKSALRLILWCSWKGVLECILVWSSFLTRMFEISWCDNLILQYKRLLIWFALKWVKSRNVYLSGFWSL